MEPVAYLILVDGSRRPIFDDGKRQWTVDDDGDPVFGVRYIPRGGECDTPIVPGDDEFPPDS